MRNLGPDAYDIAVELSGTENIQSHYDGYSSGRFDSFAFGPSGANTILHWQNFWDGTDNIIETGKLIHIGWSTEDHNFNIKDMYWTDQTGQKLPGSKIYNINNGWTYEQSQEIATAWWCNRFSIRVPITIAEIFYAILNARLPLEDLNYVNTQLESQFYPLLSEAFEVPPGECIRRPLPEPVLPGQYVVLRYEVSGPDTNAEAIDFVQSDEFPVPPLRVDLISFDVTANRNEKVTATWEITEDNNAGTNLWTARLENGEFKQVTKLNDKLILTETNGFSKVPNTYSKEYFMPTGVHYFMLEDVDYDGICTSHCDQIKVVTVGSSNSADIDLKTAKMLCKQYTEIQHLTTSGKINSCIE